MQMEIELRNLKRELRDNLKLERTPENLKEEDFLRVCIKEAEDFMEKIGEISINSTEPEDWD